MDLSKYIYTKSNFLREDHLQVMFNYFKKLELKDASIVKDGGSVDKSIRSTKILSIELHDPRWSVVHWCNFLHHKIGNELRSYAQSLDIKDLSIDLYNLDIGLLKYEKGDFYKYHIDHGVTVPRTLSVIVLLNDDYEGGDLCFSDPSLKNEMTIKKEPNKIIIWPSTFLYPHIVKEVTKGERYSLVAWAK